MKSLMILTALLVLVGCGASSPAVPTVGESTQGSQGGVVLTEPVVPQSMDGDRGTSSKLAHPSGDCQVKIVLPQDVSADADAAALHELGQNSILEKRGPRAVSILIAAHRKAPENPLILGDLATAFLQSKCVVDAVVHAERAYQLDRQNVDLAANLAQTYQIAGRMHDAIRTYREAIDVAPEDPAVRNNLAVLLVATHDLAGAEQQARKAVSLSPSESSYLINLGYVLVRQKRLVDAEMILNRAIRNDSQNPDAFNQLGLVLALQKRESQAIDNFKKALELKPGHRAAQENLDAVQHGFDFKGPWDR